MRISIFVLAILPTVLLQPLVANSIPPEVEAQLAPGADGKSVNLSQSAIVPPAHSSSGNNSNTSNLRVSSPYIWSFNYVPMISVSEGPECNPSETGLVISPGSLEPAFGPPLEDGILRYETLTNRATGQLVKHAYACWAPELASSFIPLPPTYSDIWRAIYAQGFDGTASSSGAYVAPSSPGLTGLPTNIWAQFPDGQEITRTLSFPGGYILNSSVYISEVSIFVRNSNGNSKTLATLTPNISGNINGGSFENPVAVHKFRTSGDYQISTGIIWTGRNTTLSGPGFAPISVPLGSIRLEINREYEVQELKPAITK